MVKRKKSKYRRKIEGKIGWIAVKILIFTIAKLPVHFLYSFGEKIGGAVPFFLRKRGRIVRENLHTALEKEKKKEEIEGIYQGFFREIGKGVAELIFLFGSLKKTRIIEMVTIEGRKNLDDALAKGKGVIGVSAHFGNFPLLCAKLVAEGYPLSAIVRRPRNKNLARLFTATSEDMGIGFIADKPRMNSAKRALGCLKRNNILFLLIDLNVSSGRGKVYVDFFGKTVPTPTSPVSLAIRTGSSILPMFIIRESYGRHKIIIEPLIDLEASDNQQRDITINIARLTKIIESYIRKYPTQWWWLHQRWRKAL